MTLYKWSQTAATNSTVDATINWAEGQAPSSVNDSSRAMMAAVAKYRDDNAGALLTTNTSTAYNLTSNQVFSSLATMSGQSLRVTFHTTNGASPTLNVDGLGAKNIVAVTGTAIATGALLTNYIYTLVYSNSSGEWIVVTAPVTFPAGTLMLFQQTAAPTGWTKQATHNDKALRVVSGTASSGGSVAFSTVFARTGTDAVTLAQANLPNATLTFTSTAATYVIATTFISANITGGTAAFPNTNTAQAVTGTTSSINGGTGQTSFTPAIDLRVNYVDLIIAAKD